MRSTRRAWLGVICVVAALAAGTWAAIRFVPAAEGTQVGARAPDFRLVRLPGNDSVDLRARYAGHVTLINLWATWCHPCLQEMPSIERLYQAYRDQGFRVAAASIDRGASTPVLAFAQRLGLSFDVLHDQGGAIQETFHAIGVPESFLLDRHGRIRYISLGGEAWDSPVNRARIELLLKASD